MFKTKIYLYILITSLITLLLTTAFELNQNYFLLLLYGINSTIVFSLFLWNEVRLYQGLNISFILLLGYFLRLVNPEISMALDLLSGEKIYFIRTYNVVNDYVFPTIVCMNIFYSTFYYVLSKRLDGIYIENYIYPYFERYNIRLFSFVIFILGMIFNVVITYIPISLLPATLVTFMGKLTILAILLQIFNAVFFETKKNQVLLSFYIIVQILYAIFFGFFKNPIIMPMILYCLYYFLHCKRNRKPIFNKRSLILATCTFVFLTGFVYPFMSTKRIVAGYNVGFAAEVGATKKYSNWEIISDVLSGNTKQKREKRNEALDRMNAIVPNAFYFKAVEKSGSFHHEILVDNLKMLIPRFVYPDKPRMGGGLMAYSYAVSGSFNNYKNYNCNVFVGQFAGAYMNGGWMLVAVMMFFTPFVVSLLFCCLLNNITNILALAYLANLLIESLSAFEEVTDGGIYKCGLYLASIVIVKVTSYILPPIDKLF